MTAIPQTPAGSPEPFPGSSLVRVSFPCSGAAPVYYNDRFDLRVGDTVFVEGKLADRPGRVIEVTHNFSIRLSDYKRVIARADTEVQGRLYHTGTHFLAFDPETLPRDKVCSWFFPPQPEPDLQVRHSDGSSFPLEDLFSPDLPGTVSLRGEEYFRENRVKYLTLNNGRGFALVEGSCPYTVEFLYRDGRIYDLVCSCFCMHRCKHEFAVLMQLKELLSHIRSSCSEEYARTGAFSAVSKDAFFHFVLSGKDSGFLTL